MTLTAGAISTVLISPNSVQLSSAAATSGTAPYTYQWYRSTTTGFSPGGGNILTGKTGLTLTDTTVTPNTAYYYKVVVTDAAAATATSAQDAVVSANGALSSNAFGQSMICGVVDPRMAPATVSVMIDASQATPLYAGAAVKMVDSAGGVPKVVGCTANSDDCCGFLNFDAKSSSFLAGYAAEMSTEGNGIYLYATTAIARGQSVTLDVSTMGGVGALVASSGAALVGYAYDKAPAAGTLIRVMLKTPSKIVA